LANNSCRRFASVRIFFCWLNTCSESSHPGVRRASPGKPRSCLLPTPGPGNIRELQSVLIHAAFLADGGDIEAGHIQLEGPDVTGDFSFRKQELPSLKESEMEAIKARYGRQEAMSVRKPSCCRSAAILFTENWRSTAFLCLLPGRIYDCFL